MSGRNVSHVLSFKARLLQLSLWIFLAIGLVATASLYVLYRFQKQDARVRANAYLTRNIDSQINRLIPTFLLEEQWAGTELILESIQKSESLSNIMVLPTLELLPSNFSSCDFGEGEPKPCLISSKDEIAVVAPIREGGLSFGYLFKGQHRSEVLSAGLFLYLTYAIFLVLSVAIFALSYAVMRYLNKEAKHFLSSITHWLSLVLNKNELPAQKPVFGIQEANELAAQISDLISEHEDSRRKAIVADIARQVAHDIRSPLAALEMSLQDLKGLPEERRLLIKSACEEIGDIVNVLRESRTGDQQALSVASDVVRVELVSPILNTLISEKRMQYKNMENLALAVEIDRADIGLFAKIHRTDFKRVLSNLINNSVEAYGEAGGRVLIRLGARAGHIYIEVRDDGCGIPEERLASVLEQGSTFDKRAGTGLGLFHARECVQSWSGRLKVESEFGVGTTVSIELPRVPSPAWFAPQVQLHKNKKVVILDDDPSIHLIWKSRLAPLIEEGLLESVFHFHTGAALHEWWAGVPADFASDLVFLFDYELIDEDMTGLDLIKKIGLYNQCVLVTSHFDETPLQQECIRLGVRLLSKTMAGFVPLVSTEKGDLNSFVLIDDSKVTRLSWSQRAKEKHLCFKDFSGVQDFMEAKGDIDKSSWIYIDSDLGDGLRGEELALTLFEEGYQNLYMATGHSAEKFEKFSFLKGVVGKDPPWL